MTSVNLGVPSGACTTNSPSTRVRSPNDAGQLAQLREQLGHMAVLDEGGAWVTFEMDLGNQEHRAHFLDGRKPPEGAQ